MEKLVRENLFEISLEGSNLERIGLGFKHKIKVWLEDMKIKNFIINDDLSIDVKGNVDLSGRLKYSKWPSFIKFGKVKGSFWCDNNELTSLKSCPGTVYGGFHCFRNKLTSLEGCPITVGKDFWCDNNKLTSLKSCPITVAGDFSCCDNERKFAEEEVRALCKVKGDIIL